MDSPHENEHFVRNRAIAFAAVFALLIGIGYLTIYHPGDSAAASAIAVRGGGGGGGAAPVVTSLCTQAGSGATCTVGSSVPAGAGVVISMASEGGTVPTVTVNDGHSNTYTQDANIGNVINGLDIQVMHSKLTTGLTAGDTITLSQNMTFNAYAVSNFGSADVSASVSNQSGQTSWTIGPTSNTTSQDTCFADVFEIPNATVSPGSGWTILNQISNGDNRTLADETLLVASGVAVGGAATLTMSPAGSGEGIVQCYSYSVSAGNPSVKVYGNVNFR
jgi:hypothetical protein